MHTQKDVSQVVSLSVETILFLEILINVVVDIDLQYYREMLDNKALDTQAQIFPEVFGKRET